MPEITVGNTTIPYVLRRSLVAKQAHFTITPDELVVTVPDGASDEAIEKVLHQKRVWIVENHLSMRERVAGMHTIRRFMTGAKIPYRGRLARLTVRTSEEKSVAIAFRHGFQIDCPSWISEGERDRILEGELRLWMKAKLRRDLKAMARPLEARLGLTPKDIRIKDHKNIWGSCGQDRIVNLNWRLVFGTSAVLKYALAHEMAHLKERNHGPDFWSVVRSLMPDYETQKTWLERNEHLLGYRFIPVEI